MGRRLIAWAVLAGGPGAFAGVALTLMVGLPSFGVRRGHPTGSVVVFGLMALSAVASATGGWLTRSMVFPGATRSEAAGFSAVVGAVVYLGTLLVGGAVLLKP